MCTDGVETHCDPLTTTSGDDPGLSATEVDENNDDISAAVTAVSDGPYTVVSNVNLTET